MVICVTDNDDQDSDVGSNDLQNFPELTRAFNGAGVTINGRLDSMPNTQYMVEFFSDTECDPSDFGEGKEIVGSTSVMTNGSLGNRRS